MLCIADAYENAASTRFLMASFTCCKNLSDGVEPQLEDRGGGCVLELDVI